MNNNDSRELILGRIKKSKPQARHLPDIPIFKVAGEPLSNFISHIKGFDGDVELFATHGDAMDWVNENAVKRGGVVFSSLEGVDNAKTDNDFSSPAEMHTVDVCVAESTLAVGETGSLYVTDESLGNPAAALFSTDLFLLIDRNALVESMQEAYSKLDVANHHYSSFFSGPSATADIEAVHITGAQGEISLSALMYNCSPEDMDCAIRVKGLLAKGTPLEAVNSFHLRLERETDVSKGQDSV